MLLQVEDISAGYGEVQVLHGVSIEVDTGKFVGVIGANGMGKTTLLRAILGLTPAKKGAIFFAGMSITRKSPDRIAKLGMACVPEGRGILGPLTVYENLLLGCYSNPDMGDKGREERLKLVFDLFPALASRMNQRAETLSGGEQQMVAIGRALMSVPKLLVLDEPSLGLAPLLVNATRQVLETINKEGITVLLSEQNSRLALALAHHLYVLEGGKIAMQGTSEELARDEHLKEIYLGTC